MDSEARGKRVANEELFSKLGLRRFVNTPAQHQHQHQQNSPSDEQSGSSNHTITIILIVLLFSLYIYAAFLSKLLPPTGHVLLDFVRDDCFYCFLVPLSVLPTYLIIYFNWLAMRIFESS